MIFSKSLKKSPLATHANFRKGRKIVNFNSEAEGNKKNLEFQISTQLSDNIKRFADDGKRNRHEMRKT